MTKALNLKTKKVEKMEVKCVEKDGNKYRLTGHSASNKKQKMSKYVSKKEADKIRKELKKPADDEGICTIL